MSKMPNCVVIVVNWNSWDLLIKCLTCLEAQTLAPRSVIVIDNASRVPPPDGLQDRFSKVRFVFNQTNTGFAVANNQGIRLVETDTNITWVALLNPDAFPEPTWLESLFKAVKAHPDYSFFGSRQLMDSDPTVLDGDGDYYHVSGSAWRNGYGEALSKASNEIREIFSPCAAAAIYKKSALLDVGGFDERFSP
jgi:GT2 family glycosyltransferase